MRGEVVDSENGNVIVDFTAKAMASDMDERGSDINGTDVLVSDSIIMTKQEHSPGSMKAESLVTATLSADGTSLADEQEISESTYHESSASDLGQYQSIIYVNSDGQVTIPGDHNLLLDSDTHAGSLHLDQGDFTLVAGEENTDIGQGECNTALAASGSDIDESKVINIVPSTIRLNEPTPVTVAEGNGLPTLMMKTATGEFIQVIPVHSLTNGLTNIKSGNRLVQMLPIGVNNLQPTLLVQPATNNNNGGEQDKDSQTLDISSGVQIGNSLTSIILSNPVVSKVLPPGTPAWAARINECEKIGDSYRGWVESEVDLDLLLTYHKQETNSFWGTRQSPSPAKPSTRLMWKSQYVHFDGIPFINAGSRAIVLECEFGPRRKGAQSKRQLGENNKGEFRQTCPARIYIKKVKKFPEFAVDVNQDKKMLRFAMDRAFAMLREKGVEHGGQERYYVQLPTEAAHEFHGDVPEDGPHRLDPRVSNKIRELVSKGETRLYIIRRMLRQYVEKELFSPNDPLPEKHNLTYYPTVNDLQNHIHQAVRDIEDGILPLNAPHMTVQMLTDDAAREENSKDLTLLHQLSAQDTEAHTESVTVTLTQNPEQDGQHVISKVETHLSDGTTQITTNLSPETAKLLYKLHPNLFPSADAISIDQQLDSPETHISGESHLTSATQQGEGQQQIEVTLSSQSPAAQYIIMETPGDEILMDHEIAGLKTEVMDLDVAMETEEENQGLIKLERDSEIICQYQSPVTILDQNSVTEAMDDQIGHDSSVDAQLSHTGSMDDQLQEAVMNAADMTNSAAIDESSVLSVNQC